MNSDSHEPSPKEKFDFLYSSLCKHYAQILDIALKVTGLLFVVGWPITSATVQESLATSGTALAASEAPAVGTVWVSKGACPYEGCSYGKWPVQKATAVRREPNLHALIVAMLDEGEQVDALRGEVHVRPGRARRG